MRIFAFLSGIVAATLLTEEECTKHRGCTREMNPMCGSDGVSYGNPCLFRYAQCDNKKLTLKAIGHCDAPELICPSGCGYSYDPLCGSNGITYPNQCEFDKARCDNIGLTLRSTKGSCDDKKSHDENADEACPAACIALWDPVCGTDNKTYGNKCQLDVKRCKEGPTSTLAVEHQGECTTQRIHHRDTL